MMDEDWSVLMSFFPPQWKELAKKTNALKGLRRDKAPGKLLRILMVHLACGYSLRETVVRARQTQLAELSDVALLKRLRKCKDWLYSLCVALFRERGLDLGAVGQREFRLIDATMVKEPGKTGSLWRVHYSLRVPSMACDFFKLTPAQGEGTGESLRQFPLAAGDYVIADRGYCQASGLQYAASQGAFVSIRLAPHNIRLLDPRGEVLNLTACLEQIGAGGKVGAWPVMVPASDQPPLPARVCAIRKSEQAIAMAHKRLRRIASRRGEKLMPETLYYAQYVMVLTTFPESLFSALEVLEWYRIRWQVELVFKRFKQIAQLGHLPKYDDESAKAWLYGKLFAALITEKIIQSAISISPWGYVLEPEKTAESMA